MKTYLKTIKLIYFFLTGLLLPSCFNSPRTQTLSNNNTQKSTTNKTISDKKNTRKPFQYACIKPVHSLHNQFNAIASLLAGDKQNSTPHENLYDTSYWEIYHEFIQTSWQKLEKQRLNKIKAWREKEIKISDTLSHTVFYPFSGPDFLTVSLFFPQADTFILLGLEPIGNLPDFSKMSAPKQQEYLMLFANALSDIFNKSYFITKKMLNDFQNNKLNGLLPVLCFFIKKLNYNIIDIQYLYKDKAQKIIEMKYASQTTQKPFGIKITSVKDSCTKTIYYFRYNVMDKFFNDSTAFYQYLSQYHHYITYIKSASYLLHNPFMTNMRKIILSNSVAILQDDTGIPYKYLNDSNLWTLRLYGEYDKPVKDFGKMGYQPDLARKMKQDSAFIPKLPFHLGYHWGTKKDILLFAIKKHKI